MKKPYIKFYPRDWQANTEIQSCSIASKGVWIEMLCIMAQSDRYGYLMSQGRVITPDQLARLIRVDNDTLKGCLKELGEANVYGVCADTGALYSRRLLKDHEAYLDAQESGAKGGNPRLKGGKKNQKSEARTQKPESTVGLTGGDNPPLKGDFDWFWNAYPRKVGKTAALKAWNKAKNKPDIQTILSALRKQSQSDQWTKEGGQFIPYPATWLNQGRWDDETVHDKPNPLFAGAL